MQARIEEKLWRAVTVGDLEKLELLLRNNPAVKEVVSNPLANKHHRSLLMQAAARGHWQVLEKVSNIPFPRIV